MQLEVENAGLRIRAIGRDFLKAGTGVVVAGAVAGRGELEGQERPGEQRFAVPAIPEVRIGYVGIGGQGGPSRLSSFKRLHNIANPAPSFFRPNRRLEGKRVTSFWTMVVLVCRKTNPPIRTRRAEAQRRGNLQSAME